MSIPAAAAAAAAEREKKRPRPAAAADEALPAVATDVPPRLAWRVALPSAAAFKQNYIDFQMEMMREQVANWLDEQCSDLDVTPTDLELFGGMFEFECFQEDAIQCFHAELDALGYNVVRTNRQMTIKAVF